MRSFLRHRSDIQHYFGQNGTSPFHGQWTQRNSMNQKCDLSKKNCMPCRGGVPPLKGKELESLLKELGNGWQVVNEQHLEKKYLFPNFITGLNFTNQLGKLAEKEGHHPDILLSYGHVTVTLWTHKIDGLTESDFILAAKCDELPGAGC